MRPLLVVIVPWRRASRALGVIAAVAMLCVFAQLATAPSPGNRYPLVGRLIVIDPGHGGIDGGCSGPNGLLEKETTLDIALQLRELLIREGAFVLMTRATDRDLSPLGDVPGGRQRSDLSGRVRLARESRADVMVSIHVNAAADRRMWGGIVFFQRKNRDSERLADLVQAELVAMQPGNRELAWPNNYYVLEKCPRPTVLVEVAYASNAGDSALLRTPEYRARLAEALLRALRRYFAGERLPVPILGGWRAVLGRGR